MVPLLILAIAGELARIGWYGSAAFTFFVALGTMRWLWWIIAFCIGRKLSQTMNKQK